MLVLSRRVGESIKIGTNIVVQVTRIKGNQVQLSIDAPREIKVLRSELEPRAAKSNQTSEKHLNVQEVS